MFDDFMKSVRLVLSERIANPLSGAFILSWLVWNWRLLYFFFSADANTSFDTRVSLVSFRYISWEYNLIYPLLSAAFLVVVYPLLTTEATRIWLRYKKRLTDIKNKIEETQLLSVEQSRDLRLEIRKEQERTKKALEGKDEELKIAEKVLEELQKQLETTQRDLNGFRIEKAELQKQNETLQSQIAQSLKEAIEKEKDFVRRYSKLQVELEKAIKTSAGLAPSKSGDGESKHIDAQSTLFHQIEQLATQLPTLWHYLNTGASVPKSSKLNYLISALEQANFIAVRAKGEDGRASYVLTALGREMFAQWYFSRGNIAKAYQLRNAI